MSPFPREPSDPPCASKATRTPEGESAPTWISSATFRNGARGGQSPRPQPRRPARPDASRKMKIQLLVDDRPWAGGRRFDVEALVLDDLAHRGSPRVKSEERYRAVAIGKEIDGVADPHRVRVVRVLPRNLEELEVREPHDLDWSRLAAAIALPGSATAWERRRARAVR
jgi:hypothetical protein